ncbi:MAG TPA: Ig-like domain repeat protein, partial [Bryobacteraceae bacterium]
LHFANTREPAVPEALADIVGGFLGLNDFSLQPLARKVPDPDFTSSASHYLAPADYATIYDVAPLYNAGINGAGQSIAVVGASEVNLGDIRAFRTRYGLPANDPQLIPYSGTSSGFNSAQIEGDLDLEWAGAIAPNATIYYVYGADPIEAIVVAVEMNVAPVISVSYGDCEVDFAAPFYRSIAQQANAQGITILNASGDAGAAGCDSQGSEPFATRGEMVDFPAVLPEVTGVGGTTFVEGSGTYWNANTANLGSAQSYIPEAAWNETSASGLASGGGGASLFYAQPLWQAAPGVPVDNARHVPDVAFSAALHDAYLVTYEGLNIAVGGTSAPTPALAGVIALLNQYQVSQGFQSQPGMGNINPQLYRMSQSVAAAFHDVAAGNNDVPCAQGSPNCSTGSFGYPAGPAYDMATGLGSIDANTLVTQWNTQGAGVGVVLDSPAQATVNDTVSAIVTVFGRPGGPTGTPTGTVAFTIDGLALGTGALSSDGTTSVNFPLYRLGAGIYILSAVYSGDSVFSGGSATAQIRVTTPTNVSAILISGPNTVFAAPPDADGLSWQTNVRLQEIAGVPALITGFSIDGVAQPLAKYFPSPEIPANGSVAATVLFRNLATPVTRTFAFAGTDAAGQSWTRQLSVIYYPLPTYVDFNLTATPLEVTQNTAADPGCQWAAQIHVDETSGYQSSIARLLAGSTDLSSQIASVFGTTRLEAWGSLAGTICFGGIVPPASSYIEVDLSNGAAQEVLVEFDGPPSAPVTLSATPAQVSLASAGQPAQSSLSIGITDAKQQWKAAVYPANSTARWLSVSQLSGTGPATITLTASGAGFEPGVYNAAIVIESLNAQPQQITVPVMFVLGGSSSGTVINGAANAASLQATASPGMVLAITGSNLANTAVTSIGSPLPYSAGGVSATVNGVAAPIISVSPSLVKIQVPYEVGAGLGVVGINDNGQIAGFPLQIGAAAPGIFSDANGNLAPQGSVAQGGALTLTATGVGEVSPIWRTGFAAPPATNLAVAPVLPVAVTVGGTPAFLKLVNLQAGTVGVTSVSFVVPASVPVGTQPVVLIVSGVSSPPVNVTVTAPPANTP